MKRKFVAIVFLFALSFCVHHAKAQTDLLLNGNFEAINTCTEYNAECGVEAWFYLQEVKAQMLANDGTEPTLGNNSFAIYFYYKNFPGFTPVIGTILPCGLQKGNQYTFKGLLSAAVPKDIILKPAVAVGEKFYVPKKKFVSSINPDTITTIYTAKEKNFYQFEYTFTADGTERFLTFGTFISNDTTGGKRNAIGAQVINLVIDNFQLLPADKDERPCGMFEKNKAILYNYNYRHKEMDYALYGKGDLPITFDKSDSNFYTHHEIIKEFKTDTLKLGDVYFDFNKSELKPPSYKMLQDFFSEEKNKTGIDSISIEGHTDGVGSDSMNMQLSLRRCDAVKKWLSKNTSLDNIGIKGFGKTRPIATNNTSQGRAMNRRVEIVLFRKK